ncbi:hypothetical protein [Rhizobium sp. PL01]|uniref:hypothetical protein n=1 Tax=Rhizobium sp. PL01 TaxID=3085631 RepID=UPI00298147D2|nr:hypothetical protein [Rhizobium sp. PL01]MDW5316895.1 hypothetical protein [Rhizobium sp. PL01]
MTSRITDQDHPLHEIEQFERERAAQREAQHIVLTWLQAIATAHSTGEDLALLGYGSEGMDIILVGAKLEGNPPIEYLQRLISAGNPV